MGARVVRVAINGYGVIGKRVADAVALQDDMALAGVADIVTDYRIRTAVARGYPLFAATPGAWEAMRQAGCPSKADWRTCSVRRTSSWTVPPRRWPPGTGISTPRAT